MKPRYDHLIAPSGVSAALSTKHKVSAEQLWALIGFFFKSPLVEAAATHTGLSHKTVRRYFSVFRRRLLRPVFWPWNPFHQAMEASLGDERWRIKFKEFETAMCTDLAGCYFNRKCQSNFASGYRSKRVCRTCPLFDRARRKMNGPDPNQEVAQLDALREAFKSYDWRDDHERDKAELLREIIVHYSVMQTALSVTYNVPNPFLQEQMPQDAPFLTHANLVVAFCNDLIRHPLTKAEFDLGSVTW